MKGHSRTQRFLLLTVGIGAVLAFAGGLAVRGSGQDPPPGDGWEVYREVHRLRVEVHDYPAARALADDFLAGHPERDLLRQAVEYEYGATYYSEQVWAQALPLFEQVVATYLDSGFDDREGSSRARAVIEYRSMARIRVEVDAPISTCGSIL